MLSIGRTENRANSLFLLTTMEDSTPPPIDPSRLPAKRTWHKTLGIIALIFGVLAILGAITTPVTMLVTKTSLRSMIEQGADPVAIDAYLERQSTHSILQGIGNGLLGILLTVGGVLLMKQKRAASPLLQVWAVAKIAIGIYFLIGNASLMKEQLVIQAGVTGMDASTTEIVNSVTSAIAWGGLFFGIVLLIALPLFLLIWFNRKPIKVEVATW